MENGEKIGVEKQHEGGKWGKNEKIKIEKKK